MVDRTKTECFTEDGSYKRNARKQYVGEVRRGGKARTRNWSPLRNMPNGCAVTSFDAFPLSSLLLGCCWQRQTSSQSCLNENVPGAESTTDMAFYVTLPDHAGAKVGWESTMELVPHFYSSLDIWYYSSSYVNCKNGWTLQVWLRPSQRLPKHQEKSLVSHCNAI